jgi:hypothetical protein
MAALMAIVFFACVALAIWAWLGDGRNNLRRCSRCWYDMGTVSGLRCPECGHTARTEAHLHRSKRRTTWMWASCAGLVLIAGWGLVRLPQGGWASVMPRPVVAAALALAAPSPSPASQIGGPALPTPTASFRSSRSRWERLVWQRQVSEALGVWADAVLAGEGPLTDEEIAALAPRALQAHELHQSTGATPSVDGWAGTGTMDRLRRLREQAGATPARLMRLEWALAELQYPGSGYGHRPDFARFPDALIVQALQVANAEARKFGVRAFGQRAHEVVNDRTLPFPAGWSKMKAIAASDPDPALRQQAQALVDYVDAFLPQP